MSKIDVNYNKQINYNSIISLCKLVIIAGLNLYLYKLISETLGVEQVGLWSIIISINSIANIGGNGISGALTKFVAKFDNYKKYKKLSNSVNFSLVVIFISLILISLLIFFGIKYLLVILNLDYANFNTIIELIPITLTSLYINVIARTYYSILDGINKSYLHSIFSTISSIIFFTLSLIFLPRYGILSLAYSYFIQSIAYLIGAVFLVRTKYSSFCFFHLEWDRELFKEILNYNFNLQISSICQVLLDPLNKFFITKFIGLDATAFYEISSKIILSLRNISINIFNNFIPKLSIISSSNIRQELVSQYKNLSLFNFIINSMLIYPLLFLGNLFSYIMFDSLFKDFIFIFEVLVIGWYINSVLGITPYYMNLGSGKLKSNTYSFIIMMLVNLVVGLIIGYIFNGNLLVIFSWFLALVVGSIYLKVMYENQNEIYFKMKNYKKNIALIIKSYFP